jgi:hypothetical protein
VKGCHAGLDPASSSALDSRFRGNDRIGIHCCRCNNTGTLPIFFYNCRNSRNTPSHWGSPPPPQPSPIKREGVKAKTVLFIHSPIFPDKIIPLLHDFHDFQIDRFTYLLYCMAYIELLPRNNFSFTDTGTIRKSEDETCR